MGWQYQRPVRKPATVLGARAWMRPSPCLAPVVETIEEAARKRDETASGWCRAEFFSVVEGEGSTSVSREDLSFDVRMALSKDPAIGCLVQPAAGSRG